MMQFIKDGLTRSASGVYVVKDGVKLTITNIYDYVAEKTRLLWTIASDFISSCFGGGYWINEEAWKNDDVWNNGI